MTHAEMLVTIVGTALGCVVILIAGLRWIFNKGFSLAKVVTSIDANTEATGKLASSFTVYTEKADGTLLEHEKRITRLEAHEDTRGKQNRQP